LKENEMPISVNCQHIKDGDRCSCNGAPRKWWGLAQCVLVNPPADMRLRNGCAFQWPHAKPDGYPLPPPSTIRREGSDRAYTLPPSIERDTPSPRA